MAGTLAIVALVSGYDTLNYILIAAAVGGIPTAYFVAKALVGDE